MFTKHIKYHPYLKSPSDRRLGTITTEELRFPEFVPFVLHFASGKKNEEDVGG